MKYQAKNVFATKTYVLLFIICLSQAIASEIKLTSESYKINSIKPDPTHPMEGSSGSPLLKQYGDFRFQSQDNADEMLVANTEILESEKPASSGDEQEQEAFPSNAIAGTEFSTGFFGLTAISYPACNAISGRSIFHWLSKPNVQEDFWEAVFDDPQKLDIIEIKWVFPPYTFKVFFKLDDSTDYLPLSDVYEKIKFLSDVGDIANPNSFNPYNTVVFHKPIFAKRIRIVLNKPLARFKSFGILKVKFYQRQNTFLVKNEFVNPCENYCFFVNTDKPRENEAVEAFPCIDAIVMGKNQELFTYGVKRDLRYYKNPEFCLGFNQSNEIVLKTCSPSNPPFTANINKDGTFSYSGSRERCIYIDDTKKVSPNFISLATEITVTSQADDASYKKENIQLEGDSYWSSSPGDKRVIIQIFFGKISDDSLLKGQYEVKKVDSIIIDWVKPPKKFLLYTWKPGHSWVLRFVFSNYIGNKSEISLVGQDASAIMIDMVEGYPDESMGGLASYAIRGVFIGTNSLKVKTITCESTNLKYKLFDFEIQSYKKVEQTPEYDKVMKDISVSFEKLVNIFKNLSGLKVIVPKVKTKAEGFWNSLNKIKDKVGGAAQKKLSSYKADVLGSFSNPKFVEKLEAGGHNTFIDSVKTRPQNNIPKPGSMENPSEDCEQIKTFKSGAKSGFYWIKPVCSKSPVRVFCDFTLDSKPVDILIFNNYADDPNSNLSYLNLRTNEDILRLCGRIGLSPIQITKKEMVNRIHQLLLALGYNLSKPQGIPLGWDYTCDASNNCSQIFNSLSDAQSPPLGFLFSGKAKSVVKGPFAGLGNSAEPSLFTFDSLKTPITAVVCSTNSHIGKDAQNYETLTCDTTADKGDMFEDNTTELVRCPSNCIESSARVYGNKIYAANSSICRAGIHNGLSTTGGKFYLTKLSKKSSGRGSAEYGVTSLDPTSSLGSFTLKEFKPECLYTPVEDTSDGGDSSFLEIDQNNFDFNESLFNNKDLQNELSKPEPSDNLEFNIPHDNYKSQENLSNKFIFKQASDTLRSDYKPPTPAAPEAPAAAAATGLSDIIKQGQALANSGLDQVQKFAGDVGNQVNNLIDAGKGAAKAASDFVDTNVVPGGPSAAKKPDPIDPIVKHEEVRFANDQCAPMTENEIKKIEEIRKSADYNYLSLIKKKTDAMKSLISFYLKALSFAKPTSKLSINNLAKNYANLFKLKLDAKNSLKDLHEKSLARISRTSKLAQTVSKELSKFTRLNPFVTDPNAPQDKLFLSLYSIIDAISKEKSNWAIVKVGINKRLQAAGITSNISSGKQLFASMVTLKGKNYFDFNMSIDVLVKAQGVSGVVFRVVDPFNYYALVFNTPKKFKALIRVRRGEEKIIQKFDDGGIYIDNWHTITINAQTSMFKVTMINLEANDATPQVMQMSDNSFSQGSVGVFVNGVKGFYFDNLKIDPLACWSPWVPNDAIEIIKPNSSILQEDFRGSVDDRMILLELENEKGGPSQWMLNMIEKPGSDVGILQQSNVYDGDFQRKPSMALYKEKTLSNGILKVRLIGKDADGTVSIILKYKTYVKDGITYEKFYSFDLTHSETNPKFALRKFIDGTVSEIASVSKKIDKLPALGYLIDKKMYVEVQFIVDQISISVSMNNSPLTKVIDAKDDACDFGTFGFGTYNTKAAFIMVELFPPRLKFSDADINYIIQSNLEIIAMPDVKKIVEAAKSLPVPATGGVSYVIYVSNVLGSTQGLDLRSEDAMKNKEKSTSWHVCSNARTKGEKDNYCMKTFNNKNSIESCQVGFCNVCCSKMTSSLSKSSNHQCQKACVRTEISESTTDEYKEVCINSQNPTQNIYNYCNERMKDFDKSLMTHCKLDMCNLCCVTMDKMRNKRFSSANMNKCFESCADSKIIF